MDYVNLEQCDDGMQCTNGAACTLPAQCAGVGDGSCGPRAGDGCDPRCQVETVASCGDGILTLRNDEQCDDGSQCQDGSTCTGNTATCSGVGDGSCAPRGGDGCSAACHFEPVGATCGDTSVQAGEACDLGTALNGDTCTGGTCTCSPPCGCNPTCNLTATTQRYAGQSGTAGSTDGDRLTTATFGGTGTLAVTQTHLYYVDTPRNAIRRINLSSGQVETIAGDNVNGAPGYVDNTNGLGARFRAPEALATDGSTLWVNDEANHVIRAVDLLTASFPVSTVAGTQYTDTAGNGIQDDCPIPQPVPAPSSPQCYRDGNTGTAGQVLLHGQRGATYYNGMLYWADEVAGTLRRLDLASGDVTTVAGTAYATPGLVNGVGAAARFVSPRYLASDGSGILYVSDTNGNAIRSFHTVTREVRSFVGNGTNGYADGTGNTVRIGRPRGLTSDGTSIYFVEFNAHTIRQAVVATGEVRTLVGTPNSAGYVEGTGNAARMDGPWNIVWHQPTRSLYFVDSANRVIRRVY